MNAYRQRREEAPQASLAYWLIFSPAMVAYAIASGSAPFIAIVVLVALFFKYLDTTATLRIKRFASAGIWLSITAAVCYFITPIWGEHLLDNYGLPMGLTITCAIVIASLREHIGMGRFIISVMLVSGLLAYRYLILFGQDSIPVDSAVAAGAFVAVLEIVRSNRYSNVNDTLSVELILALALGLLASFEHQSWLLALALSALPIGGFALGSHRLSLSMGNDVNYSSSDIIPHPSARLNTRTQCLRYAFTATTVFAFLFASILYLGLLKLPFWAEHVENTPFAIRSLASKATDVSESSELDTEPLKEYVEDLGNDAVVDRFQAIASWLLTSSRTEEMETPPPPFDFNPESEYEREIERRQIPWPKPLDKEDLNAGESEYASSETTENAGKPLPTREPSYGDYLASLEKGPRETIVLDTPALVLDTIRDVRRTPNVSGHLASDIPESAIEAIDMNIEGSAQSETAEIRKTPSVPTTSSQSISFNSGPKSKSPRPSTPQAKSGNTSTTILPSKDDPPPTLSENLDLEALNLSVSLDTKPIIVATVEKGHRPINGLYLRHNVLDTMTQRGFVSIRSTEDRARLTLADGEAVLPENFQSSRRSPSTLAITYRPDAFETLPLPQSFKRAAFTDIDAITFYPRDRVIDTPSIAKMGAYRISGAHFDVGINDTKPEELSDSYRKRLTDMQLSSSDLDYLERMARHIGGDNPSSRDFARRAAAYFATSHPYSITAILPKGSEHAIVRWLKSKSPGICSNYAAAYAALARTKGIPTRVITGYRSESYNSRGNRFVISQQQAHAWVEYLDESNRWIRFDPTPIATPEVLKQMESLSQPASQQSIDRFFELEKEMLALLPDTAPENSQAPTDSAADTALLATSQEPLDPVELSDPISLGEISSSDPDSVATSNSETPSSSEEPRDDLAAQSAQEPPSLARAAEIASDSISGDMLGAFQQSLEDSAPEPSATIAKTSNEPSKHSPDTDTSGASTETVPIETASAEQAALTNNTNPPPIGSPEPQITEPQLDAAGTVSLGSHPHSLEKLAEPEGPSSIPSPHVANESQRDSGTYHPYLLALVLLLLVACYPLFRSAKHLAETRKQPAELKLRAQAGRLLHKAEVIADDFGRGDDPILSDIRHSLEAQRYGKETSQILVTDLATEVALF